MSSSSPTRRRLSLQIRQSSDGNYSLRCIRSDTTSSYRFINSSPTIFSSSAIKSVRRFSTTDLRSYTFLRNAERCFSLAGPKAWSSMTCRPSFVPFLSNHETFKKKLPKMPPPTALCRIFVVRRFASPNQLVHAS